MRKLLLFLGVLSALGCQEKKTTMASGFWRATLEVQDSESLPFVFEKKEDKLLVIHNAEERITVDEIQIEGNKIRIQTPVFEGYFEGEINSEGTRVFGNFIKPSLDRVVAFEMIHGTDERFPSDRKSGGQIETPSITMAGNWEAVFSPDVPEDRYIAKGMFAQEGNEIHGTFRTTTGDYRYLEGVINGNEFALSTFDGAHAFLFKGTATDSTLNGHFYSGNHWKEPFTAKRNETYELPDAKDLTFIKEGYDGFAFSFPDASGKMISLSDERFKNKVVLVQIMGSWCPNCLEESKFYVDYLRKHPNTQLEVVGLAFEYAPTEEKALASIQRLKDRLGLSYPILLAQYGDSDKKLANKKLPMLNHILSYPTTVYVDKKGDVRRIHTGYNGTATGEKHLEFMRDFHAFVQSLLAE